MKQFELFEVPTLHPADEVTQYEFPSMSAVPSWYANNDISTSVIVTPPIPTIPVTPPIPTIPTTPRPDEWIAPGDAQTQERIEYYTRWLKTNKDVSYSPAQIQSYQQVALEVKKVGKREIRTFAPFHEHLSAFKVITPDQATVIGMLVLYWLVGLFLFHTMMLTITLAIVTTLYIVGFFISAVLASNAFSSGSGEQIDHEIILGLDTLDVDWPSYTILCPLFKEVAVVPQFVEAMKGLDYPKDKLQVLFLTEEEDHETRAALYAMQLPSSFTVLMVPKGSPQTKPRACNFGLLQARGQFVVIFDAEDKPEPDQLKKAVLTFANHGSDVACVQAKLNFYNAKQNFLTRWFTAEYSMWFDVMLPGLQHTGLSLPLGGTSNHFRTDILRALGGWDAFNVTEDCDAGLRISQYKLKTAVLDSTTYEEATSSPKVWLFQRSRWIKGYLQTYLVHMRNPIQMLRQKRFSKFFSLQLIVGAWTVVLLINPWMWALSIIYLLFHPVALFHELFPGPTLYLGSLCLIFGNFFYTYMHIVGCLKRKEYSLIKWVLLIPFYWVMMSMSAYIAFYQLIVKPHHWEKTKHGSHLAVANKAVLSVQNTKENNEERIAVASMPTMRVLALTVTGVFKSVTATASTFGTSTERVSVVRKKLATQLERDTARRKTRFSIFQDPWFIATLLIACIASIASTYYVFTHHLTLAYGDAVSHLEIARRVFDNATPGLAQLGGIWLPLPHILMLPFVWNDYLWMSGLAGSLVGMGCYLTATIYIFLSARRLTHNSFLSFVGTLVYILNPNVLYLQATPLTEPVCQATYTMTCYYLLAWVQEDKRKYLMLAAIGTFLATLARYDGWILVAVCPAIILLVGIFKHFSLRKIEGYLLSYLTIGSLGIILWLIWGKIIFGDPLYFQRSAYSSQAQTVVGNTATSFSLRHNLLLDIRYYTIDCVETLGIGLSLIAVIAIAMYALRRWKSVDFLGALAFLAPFAFYIVALFGGQVGLFDSQVSFYPLNIIPTSENSHLFNARFGSEMVAPVAVFVATLFASRSWSKTLPSFKLAIYIVTILLSVAIILQSVWVSLNGVITVIADAYPPFCVNSYPINVYLAQHDDGGRILQTDYPFQISEAETGIHFNRIIYEGTTGIWNSALHDPEKYVTWVIFSPNDTVAFALAKYDPEFTRQFTLVATSPYGMQLYHKNGVAAPSVHPLSSYMLGEQYACSPSSYPSSNGQFGLLPFWHDEALSHISVRDSFYSTKQITAKQ